MKMKSTIKLLLGGLVTSGYGRRVPTGPSPHLYGMVRDEFGRPQRVKRLKCYLKPPPAE